MRKYLIVASAAALCAAIGGAALAQPEQNQEHRRGHGAMLFQSDANSDGVVTRQEFDAGQASLFTRLDANSDGALTREEHRARRGERGHHRGGFGHMRGADANSDGNITRDEFLARPIAHFDRMDANDDGVISADERPQRRERAEGEQHRRRFNPDANNDGSVSQAEFAAAGAAHFERIDANHDGRVTREEAEAMRGRRGAD